MSGVPGSPPVVRGAPLEARPLPGFVRSQAVPHSYASQCGGFVPAAEFSSQMS